MSINVNRKNWPKIERIDQSDDDEVTTSLNVGRKKRPKIERIDLSDDDEVTMSINVGPNKRPKTEDKERIYMDQSEDEDLSERRVLRSGYLSIQNFIRDKRDEIATSSSKRFISLINEVDGMHHLVKKPREQVSDAEALRDLANSLVSSIKVHCNGSVTPSSFVSNLITKFGKKKGRFLTKESSQILWKEIGVQVSPLKIFRGSCSMLGLMNVEPKPKKEACSGRKRQKRALKEMKKPEEVDDIISKEKSETEMIIAAMFDVLKLKNKVRLENLVINRFSFAQSVENLFTLSFLVKDGRVAIMVDDKGTHYVSPRNAPASKLIMSREVAHSHFIFRFDFNDWKLMKDFVAEGSELMPHRIKENTYESSQSEPNSNVTNDQTQESHILAKS